jgi:hypothetical protein
VQPDLPLAVRPKAAAKMLSISERHLFDLTKKGHIPCRRIGTGKRKTVLYARTALEAWLSGPAERGQSASLPAPRSEKGFSDAK